MKAGMRRAGPNEVNPIRAFGFLGTMLLFMIFTQPGEWPSVSLLMAIGIAINVGTSAVLGDQLYIYSINKIGASLAVSISSGYLLLSAFTSIWVLGEKITALIWGGTFLIIAGLLIIRYAGWKKQEDGPKDKKKEALAAGAMLKGIALAIGAALCWGINTPFIKVFMIKGNWNPIELYFLRSVAYIVIAWAVRLFECWRYPRIVMPLRKVKPKAWIAFIASGSVALAIGGILFGICIKVMPVSVATPITASSPFITVLIARIFFKEKLTALQNVGVGLVVLGSISISL
jgi:DME family drug/metabolite transporter